MSRSFKFIISTWFLNVSEIFIFILLFFFFYFLDIEDTFFLYVEI